MTKPKLSEEQVNKKVEVTTGLIGTLAGINFISSNILPTKWCRQIAPGFFICSEADYEAIKRAKSDDEIKEALKDIKIFDESKLAEQMILSTHERTKDNSNNGQVS